MSLRSSLILMAALASAAGAAPLAARQAEKAAPARQLGTTSDQARKALQDALADMYNVYPVRAEARFQAALQADPAYALARAVHAAQAADLTDEQRKAEFDRALADAAQGPTLEALVVLSWRATDEKEQRALLQTLRTLSPETPNFAYRLARLEPAGPARDQATEAFVRDFPDFAPAHNDLAYSLWQRGDAEGALREVQEYVKLLPDHPNSHDSYAEILQLSGRYADALPHYQEAIEKDPEFDQAYAGVAEIQLLTGKLADARKSWEQAIDHAPADAKADHTIAIAGSYLLEGNRKMALEKLGEARPLAEAAEQKGLAAQTHAMMAVVEASGGNRAAVKGHVDAALQAMPEGAGVQGLVAVADALSGDLEGARTAATKVADLAAKNAGLLGLSHAVNAVVAAASDDVTTAEAELKNPMLNRALAQELTAEAMKRAGRKADAQRLRDVVLKGGEVNLLADLARARAKKL